MFYQIHPMAYADYILKEENENFSYPTHMHQSFELIICVGGTMKIIVDGKEYLLKEKHALLIFPNRLHSFSKSNSRHMLFIFSPKIVRAFFTKYSDKLPENYSFPLDDYLYSKLRNLTKDDSITEIKGILYSVCAELEKETKFICAHSDKDNLLMRVFSFVDANYKTECSLYDAAKSIGYDHAYISRYFKKMTGLSYNNYVNICRLNYASYLLDNSNSSILECSIDSGYKSLRTFNRNFKDYFSVTPQEYRKKK